MGKFFLQACLCGSTALALAACGQQTKQAETVATADYAVFVPAGKWHNLVGHAHE